MYNNLKHYVSAFTRSRSHKPPLRARTILQVPSHDGFFFFPSLFFPLFEKKDVDPCFFSTSFFRLYVVRMYYNLTHYVCAVTRERSRKIPFVP